MKRIPVECYSRVVGYFRPISQANEGKAEEMRQRKLYDVNNKFKAVYDVDKN